MTPLITTHEPASTLLQGKHEVQSSSSPCMSPVHMPLTDTHKEQKTVEEGMLLTHVVRFPVVHA